MCTIVIYEKIELMRCVHIERVLIDLGDCNEVQEVHYFRLGTAGTHSLLPHHFKLVPHLQGAHGRDSSAFNFHLTTIHASLILTTF